MTDILWRFRMEQNKPEIFEDVLSIAMLCPQCGTEMKKGEIISVTNRTAPLVWLPEQYLTQHAFVPASLQKIEKDGGIVIPQKGAHTYACMVCGLILTETERKWSYADL